MENFLSRLNRNPYAPIDGASVTKFDELGNGLDDWNNLIAPKFEAPEQTWGETALGVATAPARLATALAGSLSPYGADGWQVPPIVNEGVNALTAVGDAYNYGMDPDEINSRALGMAGFMMGGGGVAARPSGSVAAGLPRVAAARYGDKIYTGANHGEAYAKAVSELGEKTVDDLLMRDGQYDGFLDETGDFIDRLTAQQRANAPSAHAYDILAANASKEGAVPALASALLDMSPEARLARAREMGFDTDKTYYHGTQAGDIEAFDMGRADTGWRGKAVHMADDPKLAEFYGGDRYSPGAIYPLHLRVNNTADYMGTNLPRDVFSESQLADITGYWGAGQADEFFGSGKMTPELASGGIGHDAMIDLLRSRGYDSLNDNGHMMVFDPRNIRSVNAAFDPAKSDSANLLAANADSKPALLASALGQEQNVPDWLLPFLQGM